MDIEILSVPKYVTPLTLTLLYLNLVSDALGLGGVVIWNEFIGVIAILGKQTCALLVSLFAQQLLISSFLTHFRHAMIWVNMHHMCLRQI